MHYASESVIEYYPNMYVAWRNFLNTIVTVVSAEQSFSNLHLIDIFAVSNVSVKD